MSFFVLLEAETGKVFVKPYLDFQSVRDTLGCDITECVHAALLPEPFRIICDDVGLLKGKPLNLMASFYYGMIQNRQLIAGDCAILKSVFSPASEGYDLSGLSLDEVRYICMNLNQHFGVHVPSFAS